MRLRVPFATLLLAVAPWDPPLLAQDAAGGRAVYLAKCAKCHGKNGVPRRIAKGAPNFTDPKWTLPLDQIERSVIDGKGEEMPKFKTKLDLEQIKSVAAFVQGLKQGSPPAEGDVREPGKQ